MSKYRTLYLWMIIPMVLMQLGIARDYWGDFTENTWAVHVHYWCATLWYAFLVVQPWLATHGRMELHRTNGMIGLFLAAFWVLQRNLQIRQQLARSAQAGEARVSLATGSCVPSLIEAVAVLVLSLLRNRSAWVEWDLRETIRKSTWKWGTGEKKRSTGAAVGFTSVHSLNPEDLLRKPPNSKTRKLGLYCRRAPPPSEASSSPGATPRAA